MESRSSSIYLSVVIPGYNESARIRQTFDEIRPWLDSRAFSYEVLFSDDGSTDSTLAAVEDYQRHWPQLRSCRAPHAGKGATVKRGCLMAQGEVILVMDADHPTPIDTLEYMLPRLKDHDAVVGVRTFCGEEGSSGWFRRVIGLVQLLLAHLVVFRRSVADSQCGFKLFSKKASDIIFNLCRVKGGMYDVEIFLICQRNHLKVFSHPVRWVNKEGSRINMVKCVIMDPLVLFAIRFMDWCGKYRWKE